jgi:hypothetical protein
MDVQNPSSIIKKFEHDKKDSPQSAALCYTNYGHLNDGS